MKPLPKYEDIYGSEYVSPEDYPSGKSTRAKITAIEGLELTCNKGGRMIKNVKYVLTCSGLKKKVAVNKTSAKRLAMEWGKDGLKWVGHTIEIAGGLVGNKPATLLTPIVGSAEQSAPATPEMDAPEPGSFDEGAGEAAYNTFSARMRQCTTRAELEALALEVKAAKANLKDDELNDLRNLCAERKAELK
jgi:hypothetical protein